MGKFLKRFKKYLFIIPISLSFLVFCLVVSPDYTYADYGDVIVVQPNTTEDVEITAFYPLSSSYYSNVSLPNTSFNFSLSGANGGTFNVYLNCVALGSYGGGGYNIQVYDYEIGYFCNGGQVKLQEYSVVNSRPFTIDATHTFSLPVKSFNVKAIGYVSGVYTTVRFNIRNYCASPIRVVGTTDPNFSISSVVVTDALGTLQNTSSTINTNVDSIKTNVANIKTDLGTVKTDISSIKSYASSIKTNTDNIKTLIGTTNTNLNTIISKLDTLIDNTKDEGTSTTDTPSVPSGAGSFTPDTNFTNGLNSAGSSLDYNDSQEALAWSDFSSKFDTVMTDFDQLSFDGSIVFKSVADRFYNGLPTSYKGYLVFALTVGVFGLFLSVGGRIAKKGKS